MKQHKPISLEVEEAHKAAGLLLESAPDIIYRLNPAGEIVYISPAVRSLGWKPEELIGHSIADIIHEDDFRQFSERIQERRTGERHTFNLQLRLRSRTGSLMDCEVNNASVALFARGLWSVDDADIEAADKTFLGTVGIARDITRRVALEAELRQAHSMLEQRVAERTCSLLTANKALARSEANFRALFDNSPDAIIIHTAAGRILQVNQTALTRLGYDTGALLDMTVYDLVRPAQREAIWTALADLPDEGQRMFETIHVTRDGREIPVNCRCRLIDYDGQCCVLTVVRDLTEIKQSESIRVKIERDLRQEQKLNAVGLLASTIAHDMNNRLTVVQGYGELLLESADFPQDHCEVMRGILHAAKGAIELNRQMLLCGRKDHGERTDVDVPPLLERLATFMRGGLPGTISLRVDNAVTSAMVHADAWQLEHILINLIVNARDAIVAPGAITLRCAIVEMSRTDPLAGGAGPRLPIVRISVEDTGHGLPEHVREHIFEPFFTTKQLGKGTGLGLSIAYGIVSDHGGWIDVEGRKDHGCVFHVNLPLCEAIPAAPIVALPVAGNARTTVLIVEDDEQLLRFVAAGLQMGGYRTLSVRDGETAWRELQMSPHAVDLVFCGIALPDMPGNELLDRIRRKYPKLPVVFSGGYVESEAGCGAAGVLHGQPLVHKPYVIDELLNHFESILQLS